MACHLEMRRVDAGVKMAMPTPENRWCSSTRRNVCPGDGGEITDGLPRRVQPIGRRTWIIGM